MQSHTNLELKKKEETMHSQSKAKPQLDYYTQIKNTRL